MSMNWLAGIMCSVLICGTASAEVQMVCSEGHFLERAKEIRADLMTEMQPFGDDSISSVEKRIEAYERALGKVNQVIATQDHLRCSSNGKDRVMWRYYAAGLIRLVGAERDQLFILRTEQ